MARPPAHPEAPYVRITEQPASKALRFRYECEGRSAGSIPGVNSTPENKTYPTIQICGYYGQVVIVVSCITKDSPYRAHPHNLVGRERCERGVCTIPTRITEESNEYQFKNLGIQCVKRRDITEALRVREQLRVDPFRSGFDHKIHPQSIDLNAVRLCFQVFIPDATGRMRRPLTPAVSDIIYDKKAMSDLLIMRASHCSGAVRGGTQVILLCEKVVREEIGVVFYQEENNQVVWEANANLILVHKQFAIAFETPPYRNPHTTEHVTVSFQLKRTTDNARSNSLPFEYIPDRIKRRKLPSPLLQNYEHESVFQVEQKPIKAELIDKASPHHVGSSPLHMYPPQYEQNWGIENIPGGLAVPGPSHAHNPFAAEMSWPPQYQAASPSMQSVSPNMQQMSQNLQVISTNVQSVPPNMHAMSPNVHQMSPNVHQMSPNVHQMSPNLHPMSPNMHPMSPNMQPMSPNTQSMSPNMQCMSPNVQGMSPNVQGMSSNMHAMPPMSISPNMVAQQNMGHISPNMQQPDYNQMPQHTPMDQHSTSLSNLLLDQDGCITLNSSELSSLSSMLGRANSDLTDTQIL